MFYIYLLLFFLLVIYIYLVDREISNVRTAHKIQASLSTAVGVKH